MSYCSFPNPKEKGFTVYTKTNCKFCNEIKQYLKKHYFFIYEINCDIYLNEQREPFLQHIKKITNVDHKTFPMVFYDNTFIGGAEVTKKFVQNLLTTYENETSHNKHNLLFDVFF